MAEIKIVKNNIPNLLEEEEQNKKKVLKMLGLQGEKNAKIEITKLVYDTPQSPNYKRTGNLRNSLTHATEENLVRIGTNVDYGKYVEFGTSKGMKARPYLRQTITNHIEEYKEIVKKGFSGK